MIGARVKASPEWKQYDHAVLGVSLHSSNFDPNAVQAMLSLIQEQYASLTIDLTDTINRHTYHAEQGMPVHEAHKQARRHGDHWLAQNMDFIRTLRIPCEVIRWDTWLDDPRFADFKAQFEDAFVRQDLFRQAVIEDINAYAQRRFGKSASELPWSVFQGCKYYLLEELACHSLMYEDTRSATLYPGNQQNCYRLVRAGLVYDVPQGLQNSYFVRVVLHGLENKAANIPLAA